MHVQRLTVRLALKDCGGSRDRESRLLAMSARLRERFNVAVAHGGVPGSSDEAWFAVITLALQPRDARDTLERVAEALAVHPDCRLLAPAELKSL